MLTGQHRVQEVLDPALREPAAMTLLDRTQGLRSRQAVAGLRVQHRPRQGQLLRGVDLKRQVHPEARVVVLARQGAQQALVQQRLEHEEGPGSVWERRQVQHVLGGRDHAVHVRHLRSLACEVLG